MLLRSYGTTGSIFKFLDSFISILKILEWLPSGFFKRIPNPFHQIFRLSSTSAFPEYTFHVPMRFIVVNEFRFRYRFSDASWKGGSWIEIRFEQMNMEYRMDSHGGRQFELIGGS